MLSISKPQAAQAPALPLPPSALNPGEDPPAPEGPQKETKPCEVALLQMFPADSLCEMLLKFGPEQTHFGHSLAASVSPSLEDERLDVGPEQASAEKQDCQLSDWSERSPQPPQPSELLEEDSESSRLCSTLCLTYTIGWRVPEFRLTVASCEAATACDCVGFGPAFTGGICHIGTSRFATSLPETPPLLS